MTEDRRVVLLLGAGASVDAGLPDGRGLVDGFRSTVNDEDHTLLDGVLDALKEHVIPNGVLDVELILSALDSLAAREEQVLSAFVRKGGWAKRTSAPREKYEALQQALYSHIRRALSVDIDRTRYLDPLLDLVAPYGSLDIFSVNYDLAIELMCERLREPYTDGFDPTWNPALLGESRFTVRLHKLHGSLLWYRSQLQDSRVLKLAVPPTQVRKATYFTGESLSDVLLYPARTEKSVSTEPHASLIERFRSRLREASLIIAIGHSFRDAHVRSIVLEGLVLNSKARLLLVDPHGAEVLEASDRLLGDGLTFRAVANRIHLLPQRASDALTNHGLRDVVRDTLSLVDQQAEITQQQRAGSSGTVSDEFRNLLKKADAIGWGFPLAAASTAERPSPELDALSRLVYEDGQSGTKYPEHLLPLACAMHSPDVEVAELARSRLRDGMASECRWVSYKGGGVISGNARELPTNRPEALEFFEKQEARVQESVSKFTTLAATARFHLPNEIRTTLELVIEDLQLAHSFWRNAAASKATATFTAVRSERGILYLPTRNDEDVQNLASSAWSNGGFPRALSVSAKRD